MKLIILLLLCFFNVFLSMRLPNTNANDINGIRQQMIPIAEGIGGEVVLACSDCKKILSKFLLTCVDQESNGNVPTTFRGFCEINRRNNKFNINTDKCLILNAKLSSLTGQPGTALIDPTKAPALCIKFKNECDKYGGAPACFSGFCESIAECVDCPTALVDRKRNGNFEEEVCGASGVCRLGWKNQKAKGGNGYCECRNGMKGLACNEY